MRVWSIFFSSLLIFAVFAITTLTSCVPLLSCIDLGCAFNEVCNAESGLCEVPSRDCNLVGCPSDQRCDVSTGVCRMEQVSCRSQPCAALQVCNTQTGFCESAENCVSDGCSSAGEFCDTDSRRCVPRPCEEDLECGPGFVCGSQNTCVSGCRSEQGACPTAQYCRVLPGEVVGQCVPECRESQDCPFGQYCQSTEGRMICLLEPPCEVDGDCRSDEICEDRQCRAPPCVADEDCPQGASCQRSSGLCLGAECVEDIFSPNHDRSTAATIPIGDYANLTLCPGRADWFALDVRSTDVLNLRLERPPSSEVEVRLYDEQGRVVSADGRINSVALLQHVATHAQTLYLEVFGASFEEVTYSLSFSMNVTTVCLDDGFEENDRPDQAAVLPTDTGSPTELPLRVCGFDEDWFVLPRLNPGDGLVVRFRNGPSGFVGRVLTPDGAVLEAPVGESLRMRRVGVAGDYFLHAYSRQGLSGSYRMLFDVLAPWECPASPQGTDRLSAPLLMAQESAQATLCPAQGSWQIHWYRLEELEGPGMITLELHPGADLPDVSLTLFKESAEGELKLVRSAGASADGRLVLPALVSGQEPMFLRVDSQGAPGRLFDSPRYGLLFAWEAMPGEDDPGEEEPPLDGDGPGEEP